MGTRVHPTESNCPYFITFTTHERRAVFNDAGAARLFMNMLLALRDELSFLLLSFVVMPDHVHLVIVPQTDVTLSKVMQYIKGRFSRLYHLDTGSSGVLWQSRYYESAVRGEAALFRYVDYIEQNPVKAGLVSSPDDYPYSSAAIGRVDLEVYLAPEGLSSAVVPG